VIGVLREREAIRAGGSGSPSAQTAALIGQLSSTKGAAATRRLEMIAAMAKRESIAHRLRRLRIERRMSQRDLSSPGVSYAYISRIEAGSRTPSVKALRLLAHKLGVTVEQLETGTRTPLEQGVELAGLDFGSLTAKELRTVQAAADDGTRDAARRACEQVIEQRRKTEVVKLRKRLNELGG
jgi:transcriptional regulator with XRE-family HTH domain